MEKKPHESGSDQAQQEPSIEPNGAAKHLSLASFVAFFVATAIIVLGVSWLLFDDFLSELVSNWMSTSKVSAVAYSVFVVAILAGDLLLPIPSSAVMTHAGIRLGAIGGSLIGFLGISLGSVVGFWLARRLGHSFVENKTGKSDRKAMGRLADRYGVMVIVLFRPIPILAEASVLLLALGQMSWRPFLLWLGISNLFVASFFAAFGNWAAENQMGELTALLIAIAGPILLLVTVRLILNKQVFGFEK